MRPLAPVLIVTGTDTEVGKTLIGAALARLLSEHAIDVVTVKPVESGITSVPLEDGVLLAEATGLAAAISLEVVSALAANIRQPKPATLFSETVLKDINDLADAENAGLIIIDGNLTPVQQRNLERRWHAKVRRCLNL